jgi:hypothetical protein
LARLSFGGVISHAATNPGIALGVSLVAIMIAVFATIGRADDAGKSAALWGFLVFVPFAWIWLACQPSKPNVIERPTASKKPHYVMHNGVLWPAKAD